MRTAQAPARAALALYPPAWRARYGNEVRALLDDAGAGPRTITSLAWHALPAWIRPARQLYDRPARIRASLATVLAAWTALAGLAIVFLQLTQAQPSLQRETLAQYPVIQWAYWVLDGAASVSVLAVIVGGLPLWLRMIGTARSEHRRRDLACLLSPVVVPAGYVVVSVVIASLVRRPDVPPAIATPRALLADPNLHSVIDLANGMIGPWWFLVLVALGFAAGGVSAAGPGLALRRLQPSGPAVDRAARAAGLAAVAMAVAGAASIVAAAGLYLWAPPYAGYHQAWLLGTYIPLVPLAAAVAGVSAARGFWATRPPAAG
jgi:hypothetical protein